VQNGLLAGHKIPGKAVAEVIFHASCAAHGRDRCAGALPDRSADFQPCGFRVLDMTAPREIVIRLLKNLVSTA
jgi:hypothetical protein